MATSENKKENYDLLGMFGLHDPEYGNRLAELIKMHNNSNDVMPVYNPIKAYSVVIATYTDGGVQHFTTPLSEEGIEKKMKHFGLEYYPEQGYDLENAVKETTEIDEYGDKYFEYLVHGDDEDFVLSTVKALFEKHGIAGEHRERLDGLTEFQTRMKSEVESLGRRPRM